MSTASETSTVLINQTALKLTKAAQDLAKVVESIGTLSSTQEEVMNQIAVRETELKSLEQKFAEENRRRQVEFTISLKDNQLATVTQVLKDQNKIPVDQAVFTKLQTDFTKLQTEFENAVKAEVAKATAIVASKYENASNQKDLELKAKEAETRAQITSMTDKCNLLLTQVNDYKTQIMEEREARIKEAQARGNPVVTVQSGK